MFSFGVKRTVDADHVTYTGQLLDARVIGRPEFRLDIEREPMAVGIVKFYVERFHSFEYGSPDTSRGNNPYIHSFDIVRSSYTVGDIPPLVYHPMVLGDVISNEREHLHYGVFRDAYAITPGHFTHGNVVIDRCL